MFNLILLKNFNIISEFFLGISLIYLILHGVILNTQKNFLLINNSILKLCLLILYCIIYLLLNDSICVLTSISFNNTVILDCLSLYSKLLISSFSVFCLFIFQQYFINQKINYFEYILLFLFSILGLFFLCSSNDLITAYLSIELQSLSFYIMAALRKNSMFSVDAGLKYFVLGAFASSLFLFGSSIIYGITGTTNFDNLKDIFFFTFSEKKTLNSYIFDCNFLLFSLLFLLTALLFKLAAVPFHMWLPDVYEGSPSSTTAFFAIIPKIGLLTLIIRIVYYSFFSFFFYWQNYIVIIALLSVCIGAFTALEQRKIKSLIAYSSIGHVGYILIALSSGLAEGIQILICYLFIYMFAGLCLWSIFLIFFIKDNSLKKYNKDLTDFILLLKSNDVISFCFCIVLLSIAGIPPLIGFFVKFNVFLISIESYMYFIAAVSILCSVISTFYYIRLIKVMFFEQKLVGKLYYPLTCYKSFIIVFITFLFIFLFINPTLIYLLFYKLCFIL